MCKISVFLRKVLHCGYCSGSIRAFLLFCSVVIVLPGTSHAEGLDIYYFSRPPYLVRNPLQPDVGGLVGERIARVLQQAGLEHAWKSLPPPRQLRLIRANTSPVCGAGWFRTAERERFARFSLPVYRDRPAGLLVRAADASRFRNMRIADVFADSGWRMGAKLGFSYGGAIDALLVRYNPPLLTTSADNTAMARMLAAGRFDYMIIAPEEALILVRKLGKSQVAFVPVAGMPPGNTRHLMCSRKVPDTLMRRIDRVILDLYGDLRRGGNALAGTTP